MFGWGARKEPERPESAPRSRVVETLCATKVLPRFLATLSQRPSPVLLDLGPVVGTNVSFFGDRLSCKILVEDLYRDVEAFARRTSTEGLREALIGRVMTTGPAGVDGILCWDLFDFLDRPTGRALAACLAGLLRPKGALHAFFGTTPIDLTYHTRFIVESETGMKWRQVPATPIRRQVWQTGEITRLFDGLSIVDSVLLTSSTRETLFRKA